MGGIGSGSPRRSWIATTEEAITLPFSWLRMDPAVARLRQVLQHDSTALVELEIAEAEQVGYRLRPWVGTRTKYGLPGDAGEVPRVKWLSETSFFVQLVATRPNYGGVRLWFICPRSSCGRRCAVLYREQRTNARAFTCRNCARFAYQTQRMSRIDRIEFRAAKLVGRLDPRWDFGQPIAKPKGMHWRTFNRIAARVQALDRIWQPALEGRLSVFRSSDAIKAKIEEFSPDREWASDRDI